ncbi:MAG: thiamine pyrophosphate-binding protein [Hyphomicrobium sp.]|nr:thiamine pyrophosphate-binding protein [Hyphomicrobium sp.]
MPTGGQILVDCLTTEGVRHIFTVPGESFIAALDALHGETAIRPITCRCEAAAAMMAEATGKITGRPGVALVTRGPGAANAVSGVYVASQDATPMVLIVGLPPRRMDGLPAFQSIDLDALFGGLAKWVTRISSADKLSHTLARAFRTALSGRMGPVVIGIPEDVLSEEFQSQPASRTAAVAIAPQAPAIDAMQTALASAESPLVVIGGSEWSEEAAQNLAVFADRFDLPVVAAFRRQDHFDNRHACYVGHAGFAIDPSLAAGLKAADVVIAVGTRLGDVTTQGFALLSGAEPDQTIIHIAPDADDPASTVAAKLSIVASPCLAAAALADLELPSERPPWGIWRRDLRAAYEASLRPRPTPGDVQLEYVVAALNTALPEDAVLTNGAGNYAAFLQRYFVYKMYGTQLAPVSGTMGYGLPAAIAAKLAYPQRTVVALAGDGCFQMTASDLMTAVQYGLNIVIIIANNASLGTIRMHQEQRYPGRVIATTLTNPDFVQWAESCGAHAERVTENAQFIPALQRALAADRPAVIELITETEAISVRETITAIRARAPKSDTP